MGGASTPPRLLALEKTAELSPRSRCGTHSANAFMPAGVLKLCPSPSRNRAATNENLASGSKERARAHSRRSPPTCKSSEFGDRIERVSIEPERLEPSELHPTPENQAGDSSEDYASLVRLPEQALDLRSRNPGGLSAARGDCRPSEGGVRFGLRDLNIAGKQTPCTRDRSR